MKTHGEDLTEKTGMQKMAEHLMCSDRNGASCVFYGIYSLVFIVETNMMTQWPATREGGVAMFGVSLWLSWGLRGTKQLRAVSREAREGLVQIRGSTPGSHQRSKRSEKKPLYVMMDDEATAIERMKRRYVLEKDRVEPDGSGLCKH